MSRTPFRMGLDSGLILLAAALFPLGLLLPVGYDTELPTAANGFRFLTQIIAAGSAAQVLLAMALLLAPASLLMARYSYRWATTLAALGLMGSLFLLRQGPMGDGTFRSGVPFLFTSVFLMTIAWTRGALRPSPTR